MCKGCYDILGKILQVLLLVALVAYIISLVADISVPSMTMLYILIIVYILYIIVEFCSTTFSFLCHKTNTNGIQNQYGMLVQTPPVIEFYCECYHYETRPVRYNPPKKSGARKKTGGASRKVGGVPKKTGGSSNRTAPTSRNAGGGGGRNTRVRQATRRITTHREAVTFPYYSARDVSGYLNLKIQEKKLWEKHTSN